MTTDKGARPSDDLRRAQLVTLAILVTGYTGYYACRSNFSVALPLLVDDLAARGWEPTVAQIRLGEIASVGVLAYAIGKFLAGVGTDFLGGRIVFLSGLVLSALCTIAFALSGTVPLFTMAWTANRFVQSGGWVGMVKMTSRWFGHAQYARAMAIVSLSFLFGDALVRWVMGGILDTGASWQALFFGSAILLIGLAVVFSRLLRESPGDRGLPEPAGHPENLFETTDAEHHRPRDGRTLLRTLFASPAFWIICAVSFVMTVLRESFNTWTPTYFVQALSMTPASAARWSAVFPLSGGIAVLGAGWLGDRLGRSGRAAILVTGLLASAVGLAFLSGGGSSPAIGVGLVAIIGFVLLAPYSYLAGAVSLDFGGKQGSATACGVIDGVGYLGGILAGGGIARLTAAAGWAGTFQALAALAGAGAVAGVAYAWSIRRVRYA